MTGSSITFSLYSSCFSSLLGCLEVNLLNSPLLARLMPPAACDPVDLILDIMFVFSFQEDGLFSLLDAPRSDDLPRIAGGRAFSVSIGAARGLALGSSSRETGSRNRPLFAVFEAGLGEMSVLATERERPRMLCKTFLEGLRWPWRSVGVDSGETTSPTASPSCALPESETIKD